MRPNRHFAFPLHCFDEVSGVVRPPRGELFNVAVNPYSGNVVFPIRTTRMPGSMSGLSWIRLPTSLTFSSASGNIAPPFCAVPVLSARGLAMRFLYRPRSLLAGVLSLGRAFRRW